MKKLLVAGASFAVLAFGGSAFATTFPDVNGQQPGILIDLQPGGANVTATGLGPYDGSDDTYVGVTNHTGGVVNYLDLVSSLDIFGFEGDGICNAAYGASAYCNTSDPSGYAGLNTTFSNITDVFHGRVNFTGGLADGASAYFTLEESLNAASFTTPPVIGGGGVPEPTSWSMMLLGFFGLGSVMRRRRQGVAVTA